MIAIQYRRGQFRFLILVSCHHRWFTWRHSNKRVQVITLRKRSSLTQSTEKWNDRSSWSRTVVASLFPTIERGNRGSLPRLSDMKQGSSLSMPSPSGQRLSMQSEGQKRVVQGSLTSKWTAQASPINTTSTSNFSSNNLSSSSTNSWTNALNIRTTSSSMKNSRRTQRRWQFSSKRIRKSRSTDCLRWRSELW